MLPELSPLMARQFFFALSPLTLSELKVKLCVTLVLVEHEHALRVKGLLTYLGDLFAVGAPRRGDQGRFGADRRDLRGGGQPRPVRGRRRRAPGGSSGRGGDDRRSGVSAGSAARRCPRAGVGRGGVAVPRPLFRVPGRCGVILVRAPDRVATGGGTVSRQVRPAPRLPTSTLRASLLRVISKPSPERRYEHRRVIDRACSSATPRERVHPDRVLSA